MAPSQTYTQEILLIIEGLRDAVPSPIFAIGLVLKVRYSRSKVLPLSDWNMVRLALPEQQQFSSLCTNQGSFLPISLA